jgi:hypothetical protein
MSRRLAEAAHTSRPWRLHAIAPDFDLEDVWELPGEAHASEFHEVVALLAGADPGSIGPWPVRALWAARWRLGELLGWDDESEQLGARVESLSDRLPDDLRGTVTPDLFATLPFSPLYETDDEFAAEIANKTMHGILHLGVVPAQDVDDRGAPAKVQLAVLVKPNGTLGRLYMAAIRPLRHLIVYPAMFRGLERMWKERIPT